MVTQMGQFLDHDITLTPETHAEECCEHPDEDENCFPIPLPSVDPFYSSRSDGAVSCLEFTRSTAFCSEDHDEEREDEVTEQINGTVARSYKQHPGQVLRIAISMQQKVQYS